MSKGESLAKDNKGGTSGKKILILAVIIAVIGILVYFWIHRKKSGMGDCPAASTSTDYIAISADSTAWYQALWYDQIYKTIYGANGTGGYPPAMLLDDLKSTNRINQVQYNCGNQQIGQLGL